MRRCRVWMRRWVAVVLGMLLLGCAGVTTAVPTPGGPAEAPRSANWRTWPSRAMSSQVRRIWGEGRWLWVTTSQGLARIDAASQAYRRYTFTDPETGVSLSGMSLVVRDPDGRLWAGSQGLLRADRERRDGELAWTTVLSGSYLYGFGLDPQGHLWEAFSTRYGRVLFRYPGDTPPRRGTWESELVKEPPAPSACGQWQMWASYHHIYGSPAACEASLARQARVAELMPEIAPDTPPPAHVLIAEDAEGVLWWVTSVREGGQLLAFYDGADVHTLPWSGETYVVMLAGDPVGGGVWLVSGQGLFYSDGATVRQYVFGEGRLMPRGPRAPHDLAATDAGTVWAATDAGLLRLEADGWDDGWRLTVPRARTWAGERPLPIAAEGAALWYVQAGALHRRGEGAAQQWSLPPGLFDCPIYDMAVHGDAVWVAAGSPCKTWRFAAGAWTPAEPALAAVAFTPGRDGRLYAQVAAGGAPYVYEAGAWTRLSDPGWDAVTAPAAGPTPPPPPTSADRPAPSPTPDAATGLPPVPPAPIAVDVQGRVWGADVRYLWRHDPAAGAWADVHPLPPGFFARALLLDSAGTLWVGGAQGALRCTDGGCEDVSDGVALASVEGLLEDPQGRIWFAGWGGVTVYRGDSPRP